MITSVRLQNWTSFGALQTAPLEAITVLVGANNSGKSNFLRALRSFWEPPTYATVHRPASNPAIVVRGFTADVDGHRVAYTGTVPYEQDARVAESTQTITSGQRILSAPGRNARVLESTDKTTVDGRLIEESLVKGAGDLVLRAVSSLHESRLVHLKADAIRPANQLAAGVTSSPP
jgi:GTPase SAR1 family protein